MKKSNLLERLGVISIFLVVMPACLILAGCAKSGSPDAVSGATKPAQAQLPPLGDTYEILGWRDGIKGCVIKYNAMLVRGGEISSEAGIEYLSGLGVKTIISIVPSAQAKRWAEKRGMRYLELPFPKGSISDETIVKYRGFLDANSAPFYVHCHGGTQRGGILAVYYRIHKEGWDFNRAAVEFGTLGGDLMNSHTMLQSIRNPTPSADGAK
ncbi:MAG TPA: hypothetical protein PL033_12630 [Candidatus Brocadiia bacterium]|nr:hypothetical protein [Candidatus Brocadiia bacterium]